MREFAAYLLAGGTGAVVISPMVYYVATRAARRYLARRSATMMNRAADRLRVAQREILDTVSDHVMALSQRNGHIPECDGSFGGVCSLPMVCSVYAEAARRVVLVEPHPFHGLQEDYVGAGASSGYDRSVSLHGAPVAS